jgi:predicted transposase YbfD/YdcC
LQAQTSSDSNNCLGHEAIFDDNMIAPWRGTEPAPYLSSLIPQSATRFARLVRGHWGGAEIRNHWVCDALFEEDSTRSKNLNANLAVLRCR